LTIPFTRPNPSRSWTTPSHHDKRERQNHHELEKPFSIKKHLTVARTLIGFFSSKHGPRVPTCRKRTHGVLAGSLAPGATSTDRDRATNTVVPYSMLRSPAATWQSPGHPGPRFVQPHHLLQQNSHTQSLSLFPTKRRRDALLLPRLR
jgi:hypothetical protein